MPNNKITSKKSCTEKKFQVCLTRTLTDPYLYVQLKEEEKNWIKKNSFHPQSKSFSSIFSLNTFASLEDVVFLDANSSPLVPEAETKALPRTPYHTPSSSYASIPKFYISSCSSSETSEMDNNAIYSSAHRRNTY